MREQLATAIGQILCKIWGGHDLVFQSEAGRWYLSCSNCGKQTPGWECGGNGVYAKESK